MQIENKIYTQFKSYEDYARAAGKKQHNQKKNFNPVPFVGAALGVSSAYLAFAKLKGNKNSILYSLMNKLRLKENGQKTFIDVAEMISTAALANTGAVALNSIGKTKEQRKAKWKEAAFQIMNMAIPMLMVTTALKSCEAVKALNKVPIKIIASFAAMIGGAATASAITNATKKDNEAKRKYTIKDSVANFDDIIATIKLGFSEIEKYVPVSKILPFIYIYSGARAGAKGDNDPNNQ